MTVTDNEQDRDHAYRIALARASNAIEGVVFTEEEKAFMETTRGLEPAEAVALYLEKFDTEDGIEQK